MAEIPIYKLKCTVVSCDHNVDNICTFMATINENNSNKEGTDCVGYIEKEDI